MEKTQSFEWFDELSVAPVTEVAGQSSPSMFAIQHVIPSRAIVFVPPPPVRARRAAPLWLLASAAIAGASTFVVGVALLSLL